MMKFFFLLIWSCLAVQLIARGADPSLTTKTGKSEISLRIEGSRGDTILYYLYTDPHQFALDKIPVRSVSDDKGGVRFTTRDIGIMAARVNILNQSKGLKEVINMNSIIEPGDRIRINVIKTAKGTATRYSGKGSEKFNCMQRLFVCQESGNQKREKQKSLNIFYTMENIKHFCSSAQYREELNILDFYKKKLSPLVYKIMKTDIIGRHHYIGIYELINLYARTDSIGKAKVVELFHESFDQPEPALMETASYSDNFIQYAFERSYKQVIFSKKDYHLSILDIYNQVIKDYYGPLREQVLFKLLFLGNALPNSLSTITLDSLWNESLLLIKNPQIREFVIKRINHKEKGQAVCNFPLSDTNGHQVRLEQLKGKVLLVDVWFTGCAGCANYSQRLEKEIYPNYEHNPAILFVSINGDKVKEDWLSSIRKGKYTRQSNLNLNTNGLGFSDPFTLYYDFGGGPYSLLIDKNGKIFSGSPPLNDMKQLKLLLDEALDKSYD